MITRVKETKRTVVTREYVIDHPIPENIYNMFISVPEYVFNTVGYYTGERALKLICAWVDYLKLENKNPDFPTGVGHGASVDSYVMWFHDGKMHFSYDVNVVDEDKEVDEDAVSYEKKTLVN
jgi:hypothetical protein